MSFPNVLFAPEGEQFNTYAAPAVAGQERVPLGTKLIMQDGREYKFYSVVTTVPVTGNVVQRAGPVANDVNRTGIAAAVGSRAPTLTTGGAVTANFYAEGYFNLSVANAAAAVGSSGQVYVVDNHLAGTTATVYNLAAGHAVRVAIDTTTRVDLIQNPYKNCIQSPITTLTSHPVGVAVSAPTTTQMGWVQTRGMASVLCSAAVVIGEQVIVPGGAAGACGPNSAGGSETESIIGYVANARSTAQWSEIHLTLG